jgi:hypothetical protein
MSHLHADTTNFSVAGEYENGGPEPAGLHITFGHAKDKRTDLKRWALLMIVNAMGIPVAMKALDGNSSDKKTIIEGMKALKEVLETEGMDEAASTFIAKANETIRIQDNGPADYKNAAKPTLMKIFALFDHLGTTSITMAGGQQLLIQTTLPPEVRKVLYYLGPPYERAFERSI